MSSLTQHTLLIYHIAMKFKIAQTKNDIKTCYELREIIFIKEQNVPIELERDSKDNIATHFLLLNDQDIPIGVGRVVDNNNTAIIGRIGIMEKHRGKGAGLFLMENIISHCKKQNFKKAVLGAQEHAIDFYKKLNFETISERYIDANIPHFKMQLELSLKVCK